MAIYRLHATFYEKLKAVDPYLDARFDTDQMAVLVFSKRPGKPMVHEFTQPHHFITNGLEISLAIPDLEDYTIRRLRESDVWARFGSGKAFDDYLAETEEKERLAKKKEFRQRRLQMMKEDRPLWKAALWNAQNGRLTKKEALPYNTPTEAVGITLGPANEKNDAPNQEGLKNVAA